MSYKGFMCNNKLLIQIEDLGRSNNKYFCAIITYLKTLFFKYFLPFLIHKSENLRENNNNNYYYYLC